MIGIDAFANLADLQDLVLSFNLLTRISPRTFNSLRQLRHLYLDGNQIFSINKNVIIIIEIEYFLDNFQLFLYI